MKRFRLTQETAFAAGVVYGFGVFGYEVALKAMLKVLDAG